MMEYKEVALPLPPMSFAGRSVFTHGFTTEQPNPNGHTFSLPVTGPRISPVAMIQAEAIDGWRLVCVDATHAYFERGLGPDVAFVPAENGHLDRVALFNADTLNRVLSDIYDEIGCAHDNEAALAAIAAMHAGADGWYRHVKRRTTYRTVCMEFANEFVAEGPHLTSAALIYCAKLGKHAKVQGRIAPGTPVVFYRAEEDGTLWARPAADFYDGRYEKISDQVDRGFAADAARYRWLRSRDLETIVKGGVFAGMTPANVVINEGHLDVYIDDEIRKAAAF